MQKKILILSSGKGGGHKSSADAVKGALSDLRPDIEARVFDSMEFMPGYKAGGKGEEGYISFTTRYRFFWKCFFEFTSFFKGFSNFILFKAIYKRFKKLIREYKPDIILSVHPCFVGSVVKALKKMKSEIPVYTCILDLVKHSRLWHDKKCVTTFVPTLAMYNALLKKGFKKESLFHSGFTINEKFNKVNKSPKTDISVPNVLMVSPSLKRDKVTLKLILAALKHNVNLTVVTGSDRRLKEYLDKKLVNVKNVSVTGYVFDMDNRLSAADVLIAKAGPNMILEAVRMCVPVIITGHIPGQEERNYQYITENGYGLRCGSPKELDRALGRLFENGCALLKQFSRNEQGCADLDGARAVARRLSEASGG